MFGENEKIYKGKAKEAKIFVLGQLQPSGLLKMLPTMKMIRKKDLTTI